jgi:hypothetical protein
MIKWYIWAVFKTTVGTFLSEVIRSNTVLPIHWDFSSFTGNPILNQPLSCSSPLTENLGVEPVGQRRGVIMSYHVLSYVMAKIPVSMRFMYVQTQHSKEKWPVLSFTSMIYLLKMVTLKFANCEITRGYYPFFLPSASNLLLQRHATQWSHLCRRVS